ncbi:MAG: hypothetical protein GKR90_14180 [Pseudomonadales bacterium]|nr:hypothetical protein [Pseudomonadales bacterium]
MLKKIVGITVVVIGVVSALYYVGVNADSSISQRTVDISDPYTVSAESEGDDGGDTDGHEGEGGGGEPAR